MPFSRSTFLLRRLGAALAVAITAAAARCQTAPVAGVYTSVSDAPVLQFDKTGTSKQIGTARRTYFLELKEDGTLRTAMSSSYGKGWTSHSRGVWQLNGDRLYFVYEALQSVGWTTDARELGSAQVSATKDGIAFSEIAGMPLGGPALTRTASAELGAPLTAAEMAPLKAVLARVAGPVPHPPYGGVGSEAALKEIVHWAVAARDIAALLRVTYPLTAGIQRDPAFNAYVSYMNALAFDGVPQVQDKPEAEAVKQLEAMKRGAGCVFPAAVSPRGLFMIGRAAPDGRTGLFSGYFYGTVAGRWAILGNPYDPKKAEALRRQLHPH